MSYAIIFDYNNKTYRLPVNPVQIETISNMSIEKYEVLGLGQISVPSFMELNSYSFECELPKESYGYVENKEKFKDADYYLKKFESWRSKKRIVRFIASNGIGEDINSLVLIESMTIVEKSGEEGDKFVTFKLLEYKEFGKREVAVIDKGTAKKKAVLSSTTSNLKSDGYYIVKNKDTLWGIAKKMYGDGSKCNIIYNANKDKIKNPNTITVGQKLIIPTSEEFKKYSQALPIMKVSTATKNKSVSILTNKAIVSDKPLAGISLLLDSIGGVTRSSGGRSIGERNSSGGREF